MLIENIKNAKGLWVINKKLMQEKPNNKNHTHYRLIDNKGRVVKLIPDAIFDQIEGDKNEVLMRCIKRGRGRGDPARVFPESQFATIQVEVNQALNEKNFFTWDNWRMRRLGTIGPKGEFQVKHDDLDPIKLNEFLENAKLQGVKYITYRQWIDIRNPKKRKLLSIASTRSKRRRIEQQQESTTVY